MLILDDTIEFFFAIGLFINAMLFLPQVFNLYKIKHSRELSLATFAGFSIINFLTFLHGIIAYDTLLAIGSFFSLITSTMVTTLIAYYRIKNK